MADKFIEVPVEAPVAPSAPETPYVYPGDVRSEFSI